MLWWLKGTASDSSSGILKGYTGSNPVHSVYGELAQPVQQSLGK